MGNKCFGHQLKKVKNCEEESSPPLHLPTIKKQSIIRTTDDMPNKTSLLLHKIPSTSDNKSLDSNNLENNNNKQIFPPKTPRTIVHTSSLQKRRNSEVNFFFSQLFF